MKRFNLRPTIFIAITAIGLAIAAKAGNHAVTRCFINVTFTDGTNDVVLTQKTSCIAALTQIAIHPFIKTATVASSMPSGVYCPPGNIRYCCVMVTETNDTRATLLDLGEGLKRYYVADSRIELNGGDIYCMPQP